MRQIEETLALRQVITRNCEDLKPYVCVYVHTFARKMLRKINKYLHFIYSNKFVVHFSPKCVNMYNNLKLVKYT